MGRDSLLTIGRAYPVGYSHSWERRKGSLGVEGAPGMVQRPLLLIGPILGHGRGQWPSEFEGSRLLGG